MTWSKSTPSEKFLAMWAEHGWKGSDITAEHEFDPEFGYRFDFCWPSMKVAVEIHGFGFGHQRIKGLQEDCEKMRHAIMLGWVVVPFTQACISSRDNCLAAVVFINELLTTRSKK